MKNSWPDVFVGQSVSQSVSQYVCPSVFGNSARTAGPIGPPAWHHSTRQNAGTTMVPAMSRLVAHGTWHMPPRKGLQ